MRIKGYDNFKKKMYNLYTKDTETKINAICIIVGYKDGQRKTGTTHTRRKKTT